MRAINISSQDYISFALRLSLFVILLNVCLLYISTQAFWDRVLQANKWIPSVLCFMTSWQRPMTAFLCPASKRRRSGMSTISAVLCRSRRRGWSLFTTGWMRMIMTLVPSRSRIAYAQSRARLERHLEFFFLRNFEGYFFFVKALNKFGVPIQYFFIYFYFINMFRS